MSVDQEVLKRFHLHPMEPSGAFNFWKKEFEEKNLITNVKEIYSFEYYALFLVGEDKVICQTGCWINDFNKEGFSFSCSSLEEAITKAFFLGFINEERI